MKTQIGLVLWMYIANGFVTHASPDEAKAANDSRRLRPKSVCGTRDIVTTECRRPDEEDAFNHICFLFFFFLLLILNFSVHFIQVITCDNFARKFISLALGAFSPPSERRRT